MANTLQHTRTRYPGLVNPNLVTPWWLSGEIAASAANCIAAYQPKGAASYAASKVNLANPGTYDLIDTGHIPAWSSLNGWLFNGSTYLDTGIIPASDWTMIVGFDFAQPMSLTSWMCGVDSAGNARFYLAPTWNQTKRLYGSGGYSVKNGIYSSGIMAIAGQQPYFNGATDGAALTAWDTTQSRPIFIGCLNQISGSPIYYYKGNIQAISIYSVALTAPQVAALSAAMAAL